MIIVGQADCTVEKRTVQAKRAQRGVVAVEDDTRNRATSPAESLRERAHRHRCMSAAFEMRQGGVPQAANSFIADSQSAAVSRILRKPLISNTSRTWGARPLNTRRPAFWRARLASSSITRSPALEM
jgi:hypothetical protein